MTRTYPKIAAPVLLWVLAVSAATPAHASVKGRSPEDLEARLLIVEERLERASGEASFARLSVRLDDARDHALEARESVEEALRLLREVREAYGPERLEDRSTGMIQ